MVQTDRSQVTKWRMRFALGLTKDTYTNSEIVIFIVLPLKQWLRERASFLLYYVHCLSYYSLPVSHKLTQYSRIT